MGLPKDGRDLYIPDDEYIRFPLPPGAEAYADVDAKKIKAVMGEITAISRKSRDDGNQYWGRIPGYCPTIGRRRTLSSAGSSSWALWTSGGRTSP